jgi:uncharacterized Fe-S cluster-containing radical SAM superfamily protein
MTASINTDEFSARLRRRAVREQEQKLLLARIAGSDQEQDLSEPPNCSGFGRVRHFRRRGLSMGWPSNPLPIDPAMKALGLAPCEELRAQVFQNGACNWRCWYCFVPFDLLDAREDLGGWFSAQELLAFFLNEPEASRSQMIDLTGGQPDLVPEWVPWMMRALRDRGLEGRIYLWSDDNLSNDYFWRFLTAEQQELVASFRGYGRVGCFKGFDSDSFSFNTLATPDLFERQFNLFQRMLETGVDLYAYATFTARSASGIDDAMARFVDRLQAIDENLPLRTVPLEVIPFKVVDHRVRSTKHVSALGEQPFRNQERAIEAWKREIDTRFSSEVRGLPIVEVGLGTRKIVG